MLGWEILVFRQGEEKRELAIVHWLTNAWGIEWLRAHIGISQDGGGNAVLQQVRGFANSEVDFVITSLASELSKAGRHFS